MPSSTSYRSLARLTTLVKLPRSTTLRAYMLSPAIQAVLESFDDCREAHHKSNAEGKRTFIVRPIKEMVFANLESKARVATYRGNGEPTDPKNESMNEIWSRAIVRLEAAFGKVIAKKEIEKRYESMWYILLYHNSSSFRARGAETGEATTVAGNAALGRPSTLSGDPSVKNPVEKTAKPKAKTPDADASSELSECPSTSPGKSSPEKTRQKRKAESQISSEAPPAKRPAAGIKPTPRKSGKGAQPAKTKPTPAPPTTASADKTLGPQPLPAFLVEYSITWANRHSPEEANPKLETADPDLPLTFSAPNPVLCEEAAEYRDRIRSRCDLRWYELDIDTLSVDMAAKKVSISGGRKWKELLGELVTIDPAKVMFYLTTMRKGRGSIYEKGE